MLSEYMCVEQLSTGSQQQARARVSLFMSQLKSVGGNKQHACGFCCIACIYFRKKGMETESEKASKRERLREKERETASIATYVEIEFNP